ncbi:MAG: cupin domain-containing protein [Bacteroidales bacterium]|nr:cupin domain-containing protein [Bacteroidales bacterium]
MTENQFPTSTVFKLADSVVYAGASIVSKTVIKKNTGNISLFAFAKNEGLSEHTAPFDALVYVFDGKAEIIINQVSYFVSAGELIIMPANIPHALKATEDFMMMLVMIK